MNFASEDLRNEHEGILFGLEILEEMVRLAIANQKVEIGDVQETIEFFKLFADKCHHGKEEDLYFPSCKELGILNNNDPNINLIEQLLIEHDEGRKYLSQMSESIENSFEEEGFIQAATNYMQLLRTHIQQENDVLFPWGDKKISSDKHTQLLESFEKFEEEVMGTGTHEKLHELLHKFELKYLKKTS